MSVARQKVSVGVVDTLAIFNDILILREFESPSSDLGVVLLVVVQPQERAMISIDLEWMGSQVHSEVFTAPYHSVTAPSPWCSISVQLRSGREK